MRALRPPRLSNADLDRIIGLLDTRPDAFIVRANGYEIGTQQKEITISGLMVRPRIRLDVNNGYSEAELSLWGRWRVKRAVRRWCRAVGLQQNKLQWFRDALTRAIAVLAERLRSEDERSKIIRIFDP